jgi:hypothetical protein
MFVKYFLKFHWQIINHPVQRSNYLLLNHQSFFRDYISFCWGQIDQLITSPSTVYYLVSIPVLIKDGN